MENGEELELCESLKKLYDESESRIKAEAFVCRAYINKISFDTINEKVNAQLNAVKTSIYEVNPNFRENSKNYDQIRELISETLANYKDTLVELGKFYDGKIEQLILRKVELEASLVGSLINKEHLHRKIDRRINQKKNDELKKSVNENIESALQEIRAKKEEQAPVDPNMIFKIIDGQDVANEVEVKNTLNLAFAENRKRDNENSIEKIEKEISLINNEIKRLNEQKRKTIYEAMEVGDRAISKNIKKPKVFKSITRFFSSRFNTAKIVETTIVEPLQNRIENFRRNELSNIIG